MIRIAFQPCCGLTRTIPEGTTVGATFELVACPRCGSGFYGKLVAPDLIEKLDPTTDALAEAPCPVS